MKQEIIDVSEFTKQFTELRTNFQSFPLEIEFHNQKYHYQYFVSADHLNTCIENHLTWDRVKDILAIPYTAGYSHYTFYALYYSLEKEKSHDRSN